MTTNSFDTREFRNTLGSFATGVTIITTRTKDGQPVGLTANSFNSVSLDPPLILWSLAKTSNAVPVFEQAEHWNVHILSVEQEPLSNLFASKGADKFANLELDEGITDAPLLQNCSARLQCRTAFEHDGGDHIIYVGEVLSFDRTDNAPLAFLGGKYALTTQKPYEGVNLSQAENLSAHYNENLLGYLLGRAHFQMLNGLQHNLAQQQLSDVDFYVLSVLCIQDDITLNGLNRYLMHSAIELSLDDLSHIKEIGFISIEKDNRIQLTAYGREKTVEHIATAKSIEEKVKAALGDSEILALKLLLKKVIQTTDPGLPDLWDSATKE